MKLLISDFFFPQKIQDIMNSSFFQTRYCVLGLLNLYCNEFNVAFFSHLLNDVQSPFQKVIYFFIVVYFVAIRKD